MSEGVQGLITPMIAAIFAITFLIFWGRDTARREVLAMGIGYALFSLGFFLSQFTPESLGRINVSLTNIPYSIGGVVLIWGILTRAGIRTPVRTLISIAMIGGTIGVLSQLYGDSVEADLYIANSTYGLMFGVAAVLLSQKAKTDLIDKAVLAVVIFNVAQFFVRPSLSFMFSPELSDSYRDSMYYAVLMVVLALGAIVMGLSLIAACIKDQFNAMHEDFATDKLSGLFSRRAFETRVTDAIAKARRDEIPVSLVIGDIDHFKQVNDIWGHQVGDSAIDAFGSLVLGTVRGTDICGRVGGEEFCVLVWNAETDIARSLAERLRIGVTDLKIDGMNDGTHLTASFGTAELEPDESYHKLFARADKALYQAKDAGRNTVVADGEELVQYGRREDDTPSGNQRDVAAVKIA